MSGPESTSAPVVEGEVLAGKYRVERVLGVGGMGAVVAATHLQLGTRVALKFLLPEAAANPDFVGRFAREARAAATIKSEHVARVLDVGSLENGSPYIVMEHLEGRDLASLVEEKGATEPSFAVDCILQASEALAEAHAAGIVHRDIKPANLFLASRPGGVPVVKVLDFGIAKQTGAADAGLTKTATLIGSPLYMSPEQLTDAKGIDTRTDIWSLGVTLYELLAGVPPFMGDSMPTIVGQILTGRCASLRELRPDIPEGLSMAVARCLKPRDERYSNIAEMATALGPYAPQASQRLVERVSRILSLPSIPPPPSSVLAPAAMAKTLPVQTQANWGGTGSAPAGGKKRLVAFSAIGGAAIVLAGVLVLSGHHGHDASDAAPRPEPAVAPAVVADEPASHPKVEPVDVAPPAVVVAPPPATLVAPAHPGPATAVAPRPAHLVAAPAHPSATSVAAVAAPPPPPAAAPPPPAPPPDTNPLHIQLK